MTPVIALPRALLAVCALVVAAGCASASRAEPETVTFDFSGETLDVRTEVPTDLVAAERSDVQVTRWFDSRFATGASASWSLEDGTLQLITSCTGLANCDARFRVEVPEGVEVLRNGSPTDLRGMASPATTQAGEGR